jgi:hypothetical protein
VLDDNGIITFITASVINTGGDTPVPAIRRRAGGGMRPYSLDDWWERLKYECELRGIPVPWIDRTAWHLVHIFLQVRTRRAARGGSR